jgi:eukaryotic-like serine/threonine-protein kinase
MDLKSELQRTLGGSFTLEREMGGGGMSRVFLAQDAGLGRPVVIKVLAPELAEGLSADRFRREIQVAARLQHPNIVPLLSSGDASGLPFYTMPLVEGESLRARLERRGELPVREAISVLRDVARALAYAHSHGVVHRDVKPDNVLVGGDYAVVTDFGVAKAITEARAGGSATTLTGLGVALGTPAYMAPEQAAGDPATDHRADIYAFGILAYELLVGTPPFTGRSVQAVLAAHAIEAPTPIEAKRPAVPAPLAELVMQCLEKRASDRPQSAEELVRTLEGIASSLDSGDRAATVTPVAIHREPVPRRGLLLGGVLIVGLIVVAAVMLLPRLRGSAPLDQNLIVVAPFRVTSADPMVRGLREGMADLIGMKLTGSLRPVDQRAVLTAWRSAGGDETHEPDRRQMLGIARNLGAARLLEGTVLQTPQGTLEISGSLLDVRNPDRVSTARVAGAPVAVAALVDTLVAKLLILDAGEREANAATLAAIPWPAVQQFLIGQAAYRAGHYKQSTEAFSRAIDIDSTFALAGFQLWMSDGWTLTGVSGRGLRIARQNRDRLDSLSRIIVGTPGDDDTFGARSCSEVLQAREAAAAFAPDVPEAWYLLSDHIFHCGPQMEIPDVWERSLAGFKRALAIDPMYMPAREHLPYLYAELGDTAAALREIAGSDPTGDFAAVNIFWLTGRYEPFFAVADRASPVVSGFGALFAIWRGDVDVADTILGRVRSRSVTQRERSQAAEFEHLVAMDRGQPRRGSAAASAASRRPAAIVLDALFWDGDTAAAAAALPAAAAVARSRPAPDTENEWLDAQLAIGLHGISRRSVDAAREARAAIAAFRPGSPVRATTARNYVLLLDAQIAVLERAPSARSAIAAVDSALVRGEPGWRYFEPAGNLVVARLWEEMGEPRRALEAARRYRNGPDPWPFHSTRVRENARLAAIVGERDEAIKNYRLFLNLRAKPEPELVAERDAARRELDKLMRGVER